MYTVGIVIFILIGLRFLSTISLVTMLVIILVFAYTFMGTRYNDNARRIEKTQSNNKWQVLEKYYGVQQQLLANEERRRIE